MKKQYTQNGTILKEESLSIAINGKTKVISYVNVDDCHVCTSHKENSQGFIIVNFSGVSKTAARAVYESQIKEISAGYRLRRMCKEKDCINPKHMEVVTDSRGNSLISRKW
jgi:hypothetical protein